MSGFLWPNGSKSEPYMTSDFGPRRAPIPGASTFHRGVDWVGFSTVRAIAAGVVKVVGTPPGWPGGGLQVWIQHDGVGSRSLHLARTLVRVGDRVEAGDPIGIMGQTGTATDDHLHFELMLGALTYWNTGQIDPVPYIKARIASTAGGSGGGSTEEDEMSAEAEAKIDAIHDAIFSGGNSMKDGKKSISQSLAEISKAARSAVDYTMPINQSGGKTITIRQAIADTRSGVIRVEAQNVALTAAVRSLAASSGADPKAIEAIVQKAVTDAMSDLTVRLEIDAQDAVG